MKNTSKTILVLFLLFFGLANTQAAANDCLLDVFQAELKEKNSKELNDYFSDKLNKSKEDLNEVYNAWQVLYKADKNVDRLDINILEELGVYLKRSALDVDALANHIENVGGYNSFKKTILWSASQTDEPYGIVLLKDLESSEEIAKLLTENPDLLDSWKVLYELEVSNTFRQRSANVNAMHKHIEKIHKDYDKFSVHHLNEYVKHALNKDAYMESVLFPGKLYGDIQVPQDLIVGIKPAQGPEDEIDKILVGSLMQYTGTKALDTDHYFGAYEVRVNSGKIQRYFVDDNGVGSWKNLNETRLEAVDFVITMDGRLRLGRGHHNLSGEADDVISAGEIFIRDGVVTEITNNSGHYEPSNENLYDAEKIFKSLGVTSNDIKLKFNPNAKDTTSPIKNTNNDNVVELWMNKLPSQLKTDLLADKDKLYDLFKKADANQREKLTKSWEVLNSARLKNAPEYLAHIETLAKIGDKFKYEGKQGFEALSLVFNKPGTDTDITMIENFDRLNNMFYSNLNLPISFSCAYKRGNRFYSPLVLDGVGDEIIGVEGAMRKKKFFDNVDASYVKVGEYKGSDIFKKGDEIGFKSADIISSEKRTTSNTSEVLDNNQPVKAEGEISETLKKEIHDAVKDFYSEKKDEVLTEVVSDVTLQEDNAKLARMFGLDKDLEGRIIANTNKDYNKDYNLIPNRYKGEDAGKYSHLLDIKYLNEIERQPYEVFVLDGEMITDNMKLSEQKSVTFLLNGKSVTDSGVDLSEDNPIIFVMTQYGKIYAGIHDPTIFHHSSFVAGGDIITGGEIKFVGDKIIVSPRSGHYHPDVQSLKAFVEELGSRGLDLRKISIERNVD